MSKKRGGPESAGDRELPERVLVANVAHPDRDEVELEIVSGEHDWGDLPAATYLRDDLPR